MHSGGGIKKARFVCEYRLFALEMSFNTVLFKANRKEAGVHFDSAWVRLYNNFDCVNKIG